MRAVITGLLAVASVACSSSAPNGETREPEDPRPAVVAEPDDEQRLDLPAGCEGLDEQILAVQPTRAMLQARFGAPDSMIATAQPNRHVEGVTDSLFTIFYNGLTVDVHMPGGGSDMPVHVDVEHNRYVAFPRIGIGAAADSVIAALGPPTRREDAALVYDCGEAVEQPVRFALSGGRVSRITIAYYVD
jgi:hypothetical protein